MRATSIGHAGILIETDQGSILCDPWFVPAFFGSWFVFPRNDQLDPDLRARVERPDYLYISHLHADHLDDAFLAEHVDRSATVLLPQFATDELERALRAHGFERFAHTEDGQSLDLRGLEVAIHVETAVADGPQGDSALVVSDGRTRLLNQNDCRPHDMGLLLGHGPIDIQWLQYSGAIWYPMVYDVPEDRKRQMALAKVEAQFARTLQYVRAIGARVVVPSAGPPCFLDPELFSVNVITGDEISIFPDQTELLARLDRAGIHTGRTTIPGTQFTVGPESIDVVQPLPPEEIERIFTHKGDYLHAYARDWAPWLQRHKASWHPARAGLIERIREWWAPLLTSAPLLRAAIGANALLNAGDEAILIDFPNGEVRPHHDEPFAFRFDIPRALVETVVDRGAVDWSNALFLSCRFRAWRDGDYNEHLYNFFKSLSPERMARAEAEVVARRAASGDAIEEIELGGYVMQRWCPHRRADLSQFGEVAHGVLTCHLHGWQFDLATGHCLNAEDEHLRVRPAAR